MRVQRNTQRWTGTRALAQVGQTGAAALPSSIVYERTSSLAYLGTGLLNYVKLTLRVSSSWILKLDCFHILQDPKKAHI